MIKSPSTNVSDWLRRSLFIVFLGTKRNNVDLQPSEIALGLRELTDHVKNSLGAYTTLRYLDAEGNTLTWGRERTVLILILVPVEQEALADSVITGSVVRITDKLGQDAIWIARLELGLRMVERRSL